MIEFDDYKWGEFKGGYKFPYDPRSALKQLNLGENVSGAWEELWNELHHQGDVDIASYASVPQLVRIQKETRNLGWNLYTMVSIIEMERLRKTNPELPDWLKSDYFQAINELTRIACSDLVELNDPLEIRATIGFIALAKGLRKYGALLSTFDESEIEDIANDRFSWSELYR